MLKWAIIGLLWIASVVIAFFVGDYYGVQVHDVACDQMKQPHADVHRMFFDACLAGGVPEREAKRLYWAVARFGPRWAVETRQNTITMSNAGGQTTHRQVVQTVSVPIRASEPTTVELAWSQEFFERNDPPVEEIPFLEPGPMTP